MGRNRVVPRPAAMVDADELPRVLCFALSARERSAVLRVLRGYGRDRSGALLSALGIRCDADDARAEGGAHAG